MVAPNPHVVCVGSGNLDYVLELDELPRGDGKQMGRGSRWSGGGLAATAAVAIVALTGRATWRGVVGDDVAGQLLGTLLRESGVELGPGSIVAGVTTPVASVLVAPDGSRWLGWPGASTLDDVGDDGEVGHGTPLDLSGVDALVVDMSAPVFAARALDDARGKNIPTVLDCEMLDGDQAAAVIPRAGHIVFSADGLTRYTGTADVEVALATAARRLPDAVVGVTLGADGSAWNAPGGIWRLSAPRVEARDTTGCGDVFHGAYALAVAEGRDLAAAVTFATAAAALKAERGNGWSGMASRADVDALISKGWS